MDKHLEMLISQMDKNPGVSEDQIKQITTQLDFRLPDDYLSFLRESNGGEGPIGEARYLSLLKLQELIEWNIKYGVDKYAPSYFIFGSNAGGTAFAFDKKNGSVVSFEFVGMLIDELPNILANDFTGFLEYLYYDV